MDQRLVNGTQLDTFRIVRLIGKGGMGEVYEAYEDLLNRKVALKIIAIDSPAEQGNTSKTVGQQEAIRSFISEGQALAKLNHPNVVTIYRLGVSQGIHYIAMEYVEGRSLKTLISKGEVDFQYALQIFDKIVAGTRALHEKSIIHRDLKPKNILISKDKTIKIVDFGISETHKENKAANTSGKIVGSVFYIPPEVIRGQPATLKSDIWNLGVILYEMLTGEKPFYGDTPEEILRKVREKDVSFPLTKRMFIPDGLQSLVLKMCARNPDERHQTVEEAQRELRTLISNFKNNNAGGIKSSTGKLLTPMRNTAKIKTATQGIPTNSAKTKPPSSRFGLAMSLVLALSAAAWWANKHKDQFIPTKFAKVKTPELAPTLAPKQEVVTLEVEPTAVPSVPTDTQKRSYASVEPTVAPVPTSEPKPLVPKTVAAPKSIKIAQPKILKNKTNLVLRFDSKPRSRDLASLQKAISNPPILTWSNIKGVKEYLVEVSEDVGFSSVIEENRTRGANFKFLPGSAGTYYWRVKGIGENGSEGPLSKAGQTNISLPSPQISKPKYKFTEKTTLAETQLSWASVPFATSYKVSVSKDVKGNNIVFEEITTDDKINYLPTSPGSYYLRVTALNYDRKPASVPSSPAVIELAKPELLNTPDLNTPFEGISVPNQGAIATPLIFGWSQVKGATSYQIQLARGSEFANVVFEKTVRAAEFVFTEQLSPGVVYWRVKAMSKNRESNWTQSRSFTLD